MTQPRARRRKDARPAELLEAALDVFAEKGFAAARMEDIAARANAAKGTVYLYFPSKQAVFEELVRTAILPRLEQLEALSGAPAASATERLRRILGGMSMLLAEPRRVRIPKLVMAEAGNFPELARFYHAVVVKRGLGLLASILEAGIASGEFRPHDPRLAARLFIAPFLLGAVWRTTFEPIDEGPPFDPEAFLTAHLDVFLHGLAAGKEPLP